MNDLILIYLYAAFYVAVAAYAHYRSDNMLLALGTGLLLTPIGALIVCMGRERKPSLNGMCNAELFKAHAYSHSGDKLRAEHHYKLALYYRLRYIANPERAAKDKVVTGIKASIKKCAENIAQHAE